MRGRALRLPHPGRKEQERAEGGHLYRYSFTEDALAVVTTTAAATTPISGKGMLSTSVMAGMAYVAFPVPRLISLEVVEALRPVPWQRSVVPVPRVKAVIYVAIEAAVAVEPGAGSNKQPADKPVGPVVAIGRAVVGSVVEVAIRANRGDSNVDGDLGWTQGCTAQQRSCKG